jgi:aminoglycoside phosphotransferase
MSCRPGVTLIVVALLLPLVGADGLARRTRRPGTPRPHPIPNSRTIPLAADLYDSQRRGPGDYAAVSERQAVQIFRSATGSAPGIRFDSRRPELGIQRYVSSRTATPASVRQVSSGKSGARVFFVKQGRRTSVLKVFGGVETMLREAAAIQTVKRQGLEHLHTARLLGVTLATDDRGRQVGATLQSKAPGRSIDDQMSRAGQARGADREARVSRLAEMARHVAVGLAELHSKSAGRRLTRRDKMDNDVVWFQQTWRALKRNPRLDANLLASLDAGMQRVVDSYLEAPIRGSITHGDARGANFFVDGKNRVTMIDNETLMRSVFKGAGVGSFAGDVGRFIETTAIVGREKNMTPREVSRIQRAFLFAYRRNAGEGLAPRPSFRAATRFFQVNMAAVALKNDLRDYPRVEPGRLPSYQRLLQLLRPASHGR